MSNLRKGNISIARHSAAQVLTEDTGGAFQAQVAGLKQFSEGKRKTFAAKRSFSARIGRPCWRFCRVW